MKIENIREVNRTFDRIGQCERNLEVIENWLEKYPKGNSDGIGSNGKLYGLQVGEGIRHSGHHLDLSGTLIQTEVIQFIQQSLVDQVKKDKEYIKTL